MNRAILIVDDEEKIREVLTSYLSKEGFTILEAANGKEALKVIEQETLDFIILDLMLPDVTGEMICQKTRELSPVPILMLTAKVSERDRIKGLSIGADDYVVKPFSPKEVVARVKAILRRSSHDLLTSRVSFQNGDLVIDMDKQIVLKNGEVVHLTPAEFKLLLVLARHPDRPFSREELIEKVFGFSYAGDDRTIDQHVKNLRQKIEKDPKKPFYVIAVYGFGYRFVGGKS
ncbi:response regulator transcription factor [Shimazuella kribbensis]|uniref:response regulator transcription factor n=1 Tax=Shimazuella kribbensis TaxID=139808 RepID=UPI00048D5209|nr:response regulator transcription factor [Shimazuella kribbensis]